MVNLTQNIEKGSVLWSIIADKGSKDSGRMIKDMVMEYKSLEVEVFMKEITSKTKCMDKGSMYGLEDKFIKDSGIII